MSKAYMGSTWCPPDGLWGRVSEDEVDRDDALCCKYLCAINLVKADMPTPKAKKWKTTKHILVITHSNRSDPRLKPLGYDKQMRKAQRTRNAMFTEVRHGSSLCH